MQPDFGVEYSILFRSIKIWDVSSRQCVVSLGGHVHRVCWASLHCGGVDGDKMVTSSLDSSLKIWDLEAVLSPGRQMPAVGGLHYVVLRATSNFANDGGGDCRCVLATNQGWGVACEISTASISAAANGQQVPAWQVAGTASAHNGFVEAAAFTADSSFLVTIDTGHGGQYSVRYQ
jgi:hypothetical protein